MIFSFSFIIVLSLSFIPWYFSVRSCGCAGVCPPFTKGSCGIRSSAFFNKNNAALQAGFGCIKPCAVSPRSLQTLMIRIPHPPSAVKHFLRLPRSAVFQTVCPPHRQRYAGAPVFPSPSPRRTRRIGLPGGGAGPLRQTRIAAAPSAPALIRRPGGWPCSPPVRAGVFPLRPRAPARAPSGYLFSAEFAIISIHAGSALFPPGASASGGRAAAPLLHAIDSAYPRPYNKKQNKPRRAFP